MTMSYTKDLEGRLRDSRNTQRARGTVKVENEIGNEWRMSESENGTQN